jgi:hypothetical protein
MRCATRQHNLPFHLCILVTYRARSSTKYQRTVRTSRIRFELSCQSPTCKKPSCRPHPSRGCNFPHVAVSCVIVVRMRAKPKGSTMVLLRCSFWEGRNCFRIQAILSSQEKPNQHCFASNMHTHSNLTSTVFTRDLMRAVTHTLNTQSDAAAGSTRVNSPWWPHSRTSEIAFASKSAGMFRNS